MIKSRMIRWAGHVACMGTIIKTYKNMTGTPDWKRPLGRPKLRWRIILFICNLGMNLKVTGTEDGN